jgi:hypothetical protein
MTLYQYFISNWKENLQYPDTGIQPLPLYDNPTLSLHGLVDLIAALEDELATCGGIVPLLANELRDALVQEVSHDHSN